MGLYYTFFYGCVIKKESVGIQSILEDICKQNEWDLFEEDTIFIVDFRSKSIKDNGCTCFETNSTNQRRLIYGDKSIEIDQELYDDVVLKLHDFTDNFRWIRRQFYSGDMSYTYIIEQRMDESLNEDDKKRLRDDGLLEDIEEPTLKK